MSFRRSLDGIDDKQRHDQERDLEGAVRRLVDLTGSYRSTICPPQECEEVILDINVDGARYLLLRTPSSPRALNSLSPREREIVRMVAKGYHNKTIASALQISSWTVRTHLRRTFAKLGVTSRAAMVGRVLEEHKATRE